MSTSEPSTRHGQAGTWEAQWFLEGRGWKTHSLCVLERHRIALSSLASSLRQETFSSNPQSRGWTQPAGPQCPERILNARVWHVAGCALRAQRVSTCACVHTSMCCTGIGLLCKMEAPSSPGAMVRLETTIRPSLPPIA